MFDWLNNLINGNNVDTHLCPWCLDGIGQPRDRRAANGPGTCLACEKEFPKGFLANVEQRPVFFNPWVGYSGHGKTVGQYFQTVALEKLNSVWPTFDTRAMTDDTQIGRRRIKQDIQQKKLPELTKAVQKEPHIFTLENLPGRWLKGGQTGRTLVVRDLPGEAFTQGLTAAPAVTELLKKARTAVLLFSLADLEDPVRNSDQTTIADLMDVCLESMEGSERLGNRKPGVVVVLSQMDRLKAELYRAHRPLHDYLLNDPIAAAINAPGAPAAFDLERYMKDMADMSDVIKQFLLARPSQSSDLMKLLGRADKREVKVRFAVTSSLGHEPDRTTKPPSLREDPIPCRVLDPLFSALELETGH